MALNDSQIQQRIATSSNTILLRLSVSRPNLTAMVNHTTTSSKFASGVGVAMNLSIMLVALVSVAVLVKNYLVRRSEPSASEVAQARPSASQASANSPGPKRGLAEGTRLSVPGVDWSESSETILLALSNKCHFCSESAPFYQRLVGEVAQRKDIQLIAVFPQEVSEARKYLDGLGVSIEQVRQAPLDSLGVRGTPTLVIVDKTGAVKQSWIGRLTLERESDVLSRVKT